MSAVRDFSGMFRGASTVFFAFVGFDGVSSLAEETADPVRMLPIGILGSLLISALFYLFVKDDWWPRAPQRPRQVPLPVPVAVLVATASALNSVSRTA